MSRHKFEKFQREKSLEQNRHFGSAKFGYTWKIIVLSCPGASFFFQNYPSIFGHDRLGL